MFAKFYFAKIVKDERKIKLALIFSQRDVSYFRYLSQFSKKFRLLYKKNGSSTRNIYNRGIHRILHLRIPRLYFTRCKPPIL